MNKIYFGYITMTHGLKGELKLYTDFSLKEKVLKKDFPIYISDESHVLSSVRSHKDYYLITIDGLNDINLVEKFRHSKIFIDEKDLNLKDEVLLENIIDYLVMEKEETLGKIEGFLYNKGGILLSVKGSKKFYIPYQDEFIENIDQENKCVMVKNVRGYLI